MGPLLRFITVFLGFGFLSSAFAWDLALVGGFNYSHPSVNPDPPNGATLSTKSAFDFGALTSFSLGEKYLLETGAIRHTRSTVLEDAATTTESQYSGVLIPITFRFMRAEFLGFGFGPYFAFLSPQTKSTTTSLAGAVNTVDGVDPYRKNIDIGLRANLRIAIPVYASAKFIIDGSYLFGFTDLNKLGTAEDKTQELLLLFGVQIPLSAVSPVSVEAPQTSENFETPAPLPAKTETTPLSDSDSSKKKKKKEKRK